MAFADKIFRVLNRLRAADEFEGTDIRLAIVQRIVLRHSGRAWAQRSTQREALFSFTLAEIPGDDLAAFPS